MSSSEMDSSSLSSDIRFRAYAVLVSFGVAAVLAVCFWRLYKLTVSARPQDMLPVSFPSGSGGGKVAATLRQRNIMLLPVFVHGGTARRGVRGVPRRNDGRREGSAPAWVQTPVPRRVHRPVVPDQLHVPALPGCGLRRAERSGGAQGWLRRWTAGGCAAS
uniref:Uncharacterized protein n=1 Tax=Aegilops tauschii subsp. strangulata TaxID=200361 RepID=A0A453I544_AEGTS